MSSRSGRIATHNPFAFAHGEDKRPPRVEAFFEKAARIRNQLEAIDRDISRALRQSNLKLVLSLTEKRNTLMGEMP